MYFLPDHKFKNLISGHSSGYVLPLVLGLFVLGSLAIVPFLRYAASGVKGMSVMPNLNLEEYSANSGVEHARWRLQFESGFADYLDQIFPSTITYNYDINNKSANITVKSVSPMP